QKNEISNHWSSPVCKDGYLYGLFGFKKYGDAPLSCYDIRTGDLKWEKKGFGPGHLTLAGTHLIVLGDAGQLAIVDADPRGYKEIAKRDVLDGKCWTTPILSNGKIYARSAKEGVCLLPQS
ncbi:MAG: outer membrane protein assembly factor BamB, partial [Verrucomicrobiales bacterium]